MKTTLRNRAIVLCDDRLPPTPAGWFDQGQALTDTTPREVTHA